MDGPNQGNSELKFSHIISVLIALFILLQGIIQVLVGIIAVIFIVPQLNALKTTLGSPTNISITYLLLIFAVALGFVNTFLGSKSLKKSEQLKRNIIFLAYSLVIDAVMYFIILQIVIGPIYTITSQIK